MREIVQRICKEPTNKRSNEVLHGMLSLQQRVHVKI